MNDAPDPKQQFKARLKLALAPILAIILGVVLYQNMQPSLPPPPPPRAMRSGEDATAPQMAKATQAAAASRRKIGLEQALAYDPFTPPAIPQLVESPVGDAAASEAPSTETEPDNAAAAAIQPFQGKVLAIYRVGGQSVAIVDSRIIRTGDIIEGRTVVAITDSDVLLRESNAD